MPIATASIASTASALLTPPVPPAPLARTVLGSGPGLVLAHGAAGGTAAGHAPVSNRDPGFVHPLWLAFTLLPPAAGVQMGLPLAPQPKTGTEVGGGSGVQARRSLPLPAADTVRRGVLRGLAWGTAPFALLLLLSAL
ncbi:hypothetical protein [Kitasatospora cineracea]|uniref:hypothetical protein n=1 Tax=Kitasatospora cineracea TaxID=88074 RepID=UPI00378EC0F9